MKLFERIKNLFKSQTLELGEGNISEEQKLSDLLYSKNNELYDTLNPQILQAKYREKLGIDKIEILSLYPNIQERILELSDSQLNLFVKLLEYAQKEQKDWIPVTESLISSVIYKENEELFKKFDELNEKDKWKLLTTIFSTSELSVMAPVYSTETFKDYHQRKKKIALPIINEPDNCEEQCEWSYELTVSSPIDRVKFAILGLKYDMSLEQARMLLEGYGEDIESFVGTPEGEILKDVINIINENDIKKLQSQNFDDLEIDYKALVNLESTLDNILINKFNEKLYSPSEDDFDRVEKVTIKDENGKKKKVEVKVYNAIGDKSREIYMVTHSRGAIAGFYDEDSRSNYKEDWFRANLKNKVISSCCVSNEFWGYVEGWCTFGFNNFKSNTLYDMSQTDAGSGDILFGQRYHPRHHFGPKGLIDNTLGYNEMVWKRLEWENGQYNKKAPDYIVYIEDLEDDNQKNDKKLHKIHEENKKSAWKQAKKAAAELGIPIVVVDVEKSIKIESKAIEDMVKKFELTGGQNQDLLRSIMNKFENNRGYLMTQTRPYQSLLDQYFSKDSYKEYLTRIMEVIEKTDENSRQQSLDTLTQVTSLERKKWLRYSYGDFVLDEEKVQEDSEEYRQYLENRTMDYDKFLERLQKLKERKIQDNTRGNQRGIEKQVNDNSEKTTAEDLKGQGDGR